MTQKDVKMSLVRQLELRGMSAEFYMDLVNDYIYYWSLKKKLIADIRKKGLRYETVNGNGMTVEKANESVVNLQKTTATMLKILADLKLKEPVPEPENPSNTSVTGDYDNLILIEGRNKIEITDGFELKVIPNWRRL